MSGAIYEAIRQHGEETYPNECCGALLGRSDDREYGRGGRRGGNTRTDSAHNRYQIAPQELIRIERQGAAAWILSGFIIRIRTIRRNGRRRTLTKRTGWVART